MRDLDLSTTGSELGLKDAAYQLGLVQTYAYHCWRCNYTWLPKDFDRLLFTGKKYGHKQTEWGEDLLYREPPKSCARCKSKYWRELTTQRELKLGYRYKNEKWINDDLRNSHPWMTSVARLRALDRLGKLTPKYIRQF